MEVSALVKAFRKNLEDAGYKWRDASERFEAGRSIMEFQRTKVIDKEGNEIASCVWNFSKVDGWTTGHSYGWPELIECWMAPFKSEPEPMTVDEIIKALGDTNE